MKCYEWNDMTLYTSQEYTQEYTLESLGENGSIDGEHNRPLEVVDLDGLYSSISFFLLTTGWKAAGLLTNRGFVSAWEQSEKGKEQEQSKEQVQVELSDRAWEWSAYSSGGGSRRYFSCCSWQLGWW